MIGGLYFSQGPPSNMYGPREYRDKNARSPFRPPRRAQSTNDYVYPTPPPSVRTLPIHQASADRGISELDSKRPPTIPEEASRDGTPQLAVAPTSPKPQQKNGDQSQRPRLGPPRRSYSVTDHEPLPHTHRPSADFSLSDLPSELHYTIFDHLDLLDSTCLGLTNRHFYAIHKRLHGTIPLSVRRAGPNDMEWVWHLAGQTMLQNKSKGPTPDALRVRGQGLCRKCGVSRCELHKHIQDWMGPDYEYCWVREKFGPPATEGARAECYRSNPKDPRRCGRHRQQKTPPPSTLPKPVQ